MKKQINKSEYSLDIAYLYSELAITYNEAEDMDKSMTCVRKQLAIYEELNKTSTLDYLNALSFMAEM